MSHDSSNGDALDVLHLLNSLKLIKDKDWSIWASLVYDLLDQLLPFMREQCVNYVEHGDRCVEGVPLVSVSPESLCRVCRIKRAVQLAIRNNTLV